MNVPGGLEDLSEGMETVDYFSFCAADLERFAALTADRAPIHFDPSFARERGYAGPIVFGFLVVARFSGLLGMRLPGPHSVIHGVKFDLVRPVYLDQRICYRVQVKRLSPATGTVQLALSAEQDDGERVLRGSAQCGFAR